MQNEDSMLGSLVFVALLAVSHGFPRECRKAVECLKVDVYRGISRENVCNESVKNEVLEVKACFTSAIQEEECADASPTEVKMIQNMFEVVCTGCPAPFVGGQCNQQYLPGRPTCDLVPYVVAWHKAITCLNEKLGTNPNCDGVMDNVNIVFSLHGASSIESQQSFCGKGGKGGKGKGKRSLDPFIGLPNDIASLWWK